MTTIKVHESTVDQLKALKGYEFPTVVVEESAVLDSKKLRAAVTSMRSGKTWSGWDAIKYGSLDWNPLGSIYPPIKIPAVDFYATVSPSELFRILESAVYQTSRPDPRLFLLYLKIKNANEKTKFGGFQNSI
jgi:hypothetical protein